MDLLTYGLTLRFDKSYASAGLLLPIPAKIVYEITKFFKEETEEIYKYYLILIQCGLLMIRYEWERYIDLFDILFSAWSILFIAQSKNLENEVIQFNILLSTLKSTYYMFLVNKFLYFITLP